MSERFRLPGYERFTQKAVDAIFFAQNESRRLGHEFIGTEQILVGLIGGGSGIASEILTSVGVSLEKAQIEVEKIIGRGKGNTPLDIPYTPRAKRVLELSVEESQQLGVNYIGTEHLLLGILREGAGGTGGAAMKVLRNLGIDLDALEQRLRSALS
ncbi:Clp protease N-terminal domain-containing protein [Tolypothrix campylonemoides VB511288_2]|nr:Clp protease N-terminal domain-containing protein [Tolypothrix bouteillei]